MQIRLEITGDTRERDIQSLFKALGGLNLIGPVSNSCIQSMNSAKSVGAVVDAGPTTEYSVDAAHEDATPNVRQFGEDVKQAIQQEADEAKAKREATAATKETPKRTKKEKTNATAETMAETAPSTEPADTGTSGIHGSVSAEMADPAPAEAVTSEPVKPIEAKRAITKDDLVLTAKALVMKGDNIRQKVVETVRTYKGGKYSRVSDINDPEEIAEMMALLEAIK